MDHAWLSYDLVKNGTMNVQGWLLKAVPGCEARVFSSPSSGWRRGAAPVAILLACLLIPAAVAANEDAAPPLQSASEIGYPPFCVVRENGTADGFSVELMRAALARMDRGVSFRTGPWAEVRGWLERGEVEALPLVGRTPEREELFDFTVPYLRMHGAIVVRTGTEGVHSLQDLRGRRVGVMQGDNAEEFLRREERGLEVVTAATFEHALLALVEERCDAVVVQRLVALRLLQESDLAAELKIVDRPIHGFAQDFCFAVREGDRETLALLNEGLALVVADGTHRRLHAKWFAHLELPSDRPVVVGGDHAYPPFEFLDEQGRPAGFTVELTRAVAREMDMDVRIRLGPWADMVEALREGRVDALEGMFYSPERDRALDFSPKYLVIHCVSVVRRGEGPPPTTLDDLEGRDLVVQAEDAILDALAERGVTARITPVATQEDVVRAVAEGRAACGLATRYGALYAIMKNGWTNVELGDQALYSGQYGFAVPQGNEALLAQFAEGLQVLKDSGEYQRIYDKWLGVYDSEATFKTILKYVALIAGPILLLAVLALLWSWLLRRQVAARTRELRQSESRYRRLFESAHDGILILDAETGEVVDVNPYLTQLLGLDRSSFLGKFLWDIGPFRDIAASLEAFRVLQEDEYVRYEHLPLQSATGGLVDVEFVSNVYLVNDVKVIQCNIRNITDRKLAERRVEHLSRVLRAIRDVDQLITHETDRNALLRRSCEILVATRGYRSAWGALTDADGALKGVAECGVGEGFAVVRESLERGDWPECCRWALEHPDGIVPMHDIAVNCTTCVLAHGQRDTADLAGRLRHGGRDYGALVVALPAGLADDEEEQSLFRELVSDLAYALHTIETAQQRRAEEERFHAYVERAPHGIFVADRAGRFVEVNPAACEITGYSEDELLAMTVTDLLPPESREFGLASFQDLIEKGRIREDLPFIRKSGEIRHWIVSAVALGAERFLGFTEDVTEQRRAEQQTVRANAILSRLLDVARQLSVAVDTDAVVQVIRQTARALSGADGVTVVLRDGDQCYYVDEDAVEPLWKGQRFPLDQCISGWVMLHGQSVAIEDVFADPRIPHAAYRSTFVQSMAMAPIRTNNPLGAIGAYWRERHAPTEEEALLLVALGNMTAAVWDAIEARQALRRSEETYRLLADNTVDCIWRLSLDGAFEYINPSSETLLGYTPQEMVGTPLAGYCDARNWRVMEREIATALSAPAGFEGTLFAAEMLRRDGSAVAVEITGKLLRGEDGAPLALQGVTRDISERARAEAESEKLQAQLTQAQKMESVGRLAGGVAHDFNNILQALGMSGEMLVDALPEGSETRERATEVVDGVRRAAALTRQLLAFARKQTISPRVLDLNETVESMLRMLRRLIGEDVHLVWRPRAGLWAVKVDPGQVDQVLANLCVNARDAIDGAGTVTVETDNVTLDDAYCASHAGFVPGDFVVLAVSDDGAGMDRETCAMVFEPFFTTKKADRGTGLGLATVYGITKQNDGFVNVYSEPGEGTIFKVYLPRCVGQLTQASAHGQEKAREGRGEAVLLVEDDPALLKAAERVLISLGYEVYAAGAAAEALALASELQGRTAVLLTDVIMPEMSGPELAAQVRRTCPGIRVLFMSGYTADVIAHRGVLDEGVHFIQKPFSGRGLAEKIGEVLDEAPPMGSVGG